METLDCAVIGAGWFGLAAAKQFRCTSPSASLAVFEASPDLGGTWASHRLYPGIKTNNLLGTYEYPDFPMDPAVFDVSPGQHIPGRVVNDYLHAYASRFGITPLVRLRTKVIIAEHRDSPEGGWLLTVSGPDGIQARIIAKKMIVATGLTSEPCMPRFEGQDTFGGLIFHGRDFARHADTIRPGGTVAVLGGGKTAFDAVYAYAMAGVKVNWIIRASGHGPSWFSPPHATPLKRWIEHLANTRFLTWFSPCIWGAADGYPTIRRLLHGTAIGRAIVDGFWFALTSDVLGMNRYDDHPDTARLRPWLGVMYSGTSYSFFNYETDFWSLVKSDAVSVHIGDVSRLSPNTVHLADGTTLAADTLLAHGGWLHVPPIKFLPEGIDAELGIPHAPSKGAEQTADADLAALADQDIFRRFPKLREPPAWDPTHTPPASRPGFRTSDPNAAAVTPWNLHRFTAPAAPRFLRARDTAFVGHVGNFSTAITAHIQGLWVAAYMTGRLARDPGAVPAAELLYETVLHNRFGRWRYPVDWGERAPSFIFDAVPYLDLLLQDLGLQSHRKGGWWAEMWSPYMSPDYRTVNEEWKAKYE
ncbi:hypothetical protein F5X68DRAFT_8971 [Plectosphaerella plurivora]|uniref:Uncharacterized protein n=1 Tax=Plectosphaerella plurivora TaxID=936078 RepID=A0A9P9A8G9_9PEZI|nr:hypothetical protein F5X68DRAFT_8971 [Plectosphaerella plurivora]